MEKDTIKGDKKDFAEYLANFINLTIIEHRKQMVLLGEEDMSVYGFDTYLSGFVAALTWDSDVEPQDVQDAVELLLEKSEAKDLGVDGTAKSSMTMISVDK